MRKREKKREVKAVNAKGKLGSYKYLKKDCTWCRHRLQQRGSHKRDNGEDDVENQGCI